MSVNPASVFIEAFEGERRRLAHLYEATGVSFDSFALANLFVALGELAAAL